MNIDRRHGGPYDRGSADSYYRRPRRPHFFTEATYASDEIDLPMQSIKDMPTSRKETLVLNHCLANSMEPKSMG